MLPKSGVLEMERGNPMGGWLWAHAGSVAATSKWLLWKTIGVSFHIFLSGNENISRGQNPENVSYTEKVMCETAFYIITSGCKANDRQSSIRKQQ
jgi:hypothetical protein